MAAETVTFKVKDKAGTLSVAKTVTINWQAARFAGDPGPGRILWGSTGGQQTGESNVLATENNIYHNTIAVHRLYDFAWSTAGIDTAVARAKVVAAAGRVPWISFAPAASVWAAIGAGSHDGTLTYLSNQFATVPDPCWVSPVNEPESKGGTAANHQAMARRWCQKIVAPNVAKLPVLYGVYPGTPLQNGDYADWIGPATGTNKVAWNLLGWNVYPNRLQTVQGDLDPVLDVLDPINAAYGLPSAIGELGCRQTTDDASPGWIRRAFDACLAHGIVGVCYFDWHNAADVAHWELTNPSSRLTDFCTCLARPEVYYPARA